MNAHPAEQANEWIWRSEYDIETAEAMLKTGRYLYVAFCCQQSVEKRLKAIIVEKTSTVPPRIHDLIRLAERAGIELPQSQFEELDILNSYYIESRYPEELRRLCAGLDRKVASRRLQITKDLLSWLVQQKN